MKHPACFLTGHTLAPGEGVEDTELEELPVMTFHRTSANDEERTRDAVLWERVFMYRRTVFSFGLEGLGLESRTYVATPIGKSSRVPATPPRAPW